MLNIIVFSKDRACQLELMLRSLKLFLHNWQSYSVYIIYNYSNSDYQQGYELVKKQHSEFHYLPESQEKINNDFKNKVLECFSNNSPYTMFLVDDLVFKSFVDLIDTTFQIFVNNPDILCLSLRLSPNIKYCYTTNSFSPPPSFDENLVWNWQNQSKNTDWGYPMSLDGHIFRTLEIYHLILNQSFNNPNTFESKLANHTLSSPQMICYSESKIVNIPANKVQNIYSNRYGQMAEVNELNQNFLNNNCLSLKPILDTQNISVHQEIPLHFLPYSQDKHEISVIILCANDAFQLIYQIESLLVQTICPKEIICICNEKYLTIINTAELLKQLYPNIKLIINSSGNDTQIIEKIITENNKVIILETNQSISSTFIEDKFNNKNLEDTAFNNLQKLKYEKEKLIFKSEQIESQLQFQLEFTNPQLHQTQIQLQQIQSQLNQTQIQLQQTQSQLNQTQIQLQQTQSQLNQTQIQLQQTQIQLQQTHIEINAIKSSKFWKLREKWFEFRQKIGITNNEQGLSLKKFSRIVKNKIEIKPKIIVEIEQQKWDQNLPLVSVIIPCYNYGKYVEEAIDSVLNQTFQNLEIIVVDDGSTDHDTIQILDNLNKPKTKLIRTTNQKLPAARNNGIKSAKGKYICCLDADDLLKPTYLEKCLIKLETENLDICCTWVKEFGDHDVIHSNIEFNLETLIYQNCLHVSAIFKRSIWEKTGGYDETMINGYEDWNFWIAISKAGGIGGKIDEPLFLYRKHGHSMINSAFENHDILYEQIKANHQELYFNKNIIKEINSNHQKYIVKNGYVNLASSFQYPSQVNKNKNHILFALPWIVTGGVDTVILQLTKTLKSQGFTITVCTTVKTSPDMGNNTPKYEEFTTEIYDLYKFIKPETWYDFIFYLIKSRNIDIIFLAGSSYFYSILPNIKQDFPNIKIIDQLYNEFGHIDNNRRYANYIDINIVENETVENCLLFTYQEKSEKVCLINNGVDTKYFNPSTYNENLFLKVPIPKDKFIILFLGRFSEEKCPHLFVKIVNHLKDNDKLYFIMAGSGNLYDTTTELINKYELGNKIYLPGFVDTREYLSISNLLILPSQIDGRPNAVLESLSMEVPVIASSVGGLPKIIQDGYNGFLCESGNVDNFVNRIQEVINDQNLYLTMKNNARDYAINNLDLTTVQSKYMEVFDQLLRSKNS